MLWHPLLLATLSALATAQDVSDGVGPDGTAPTPAELSKGRQEFNFLSPQLDYSDGWLSNGATAFTSSGSVTLRALGTGVKFNAEGSKRLFVNGTQAADAQITSDAAEVNNLPYSWYEFTLECASNCTFRSVAPNPAGQAWIVDEPETFPAASAPQLKTEGAWSRTDGRLSTDAPGARLTIDVPAQATLLDVLVDTPRVPYGAFDVELSPPPPGAPASQKFTQRLRPTDIQLLIAYLDVTVFSVLLDPFQKYTATITVRDGHWDASNVRFYGSPKTADGGGGGSGNGGGNGNGGAGGNGGGNGGDGSNGSDGKDGANGGGEGGKGGQGGKGGGRGPGGNGGKGGNGGSGGKGRWGHGGHGEEDDDGPGPCKP